jgi:hypothetical protein
MVSLWIKAGRILWSGAKHCGDAQRVNEFQAAERAWQPQSYLARDLHREGLKQAAIKRGISPEEAKEMALWAEQRILLPSYLLWFQAWGYVWVADVLADPEKFNGKRLADPEEGPDYMSQTPAIVRVDGGDIWVDSFAHGGGPTDRRFHLQTRDQLIELAQGDRWLNGISTEDLEAMMLTAGQSAATPVDAVILSMAAILPARSSPIPGSSVRSSPARNMPSALFGRLSMTRAARR